MILLGSFGRALAFQTIGVLFFWLAIQTFPERSGFGFVFTVGFVGLWNLFVFLFLLRVFYLILKGVYGLIFYGSGRVDTVEGPRPMKRVEPYTLKKWAQLVSITCLALFFLLIGFGLLAMSGSPSLHTSPKTLVIFAIIWLIGVSIMLISSLIEIGIGIYAAVKTDDKRIG